LTTLEGKVALITGAARGIGRASAVRLAEEGANIVAVDLAPKITERIDTVPYALGTPDELEETAELVRAAGARAVTATADVRSQAELDEAVRRGLAEFVAIDVLVANAGIWSRGTLWEITEEEWDKQIDINLSGVWRSVKAVAPHMVGRRTGSIILISSINGFEPGPGYAHYTAAKHGVIGLMRAGALELGPHDVRCNAICPGVIDTPQNSWQGALDLIAGHQGGTMEERAAIGKTFGALASDGLIPASAIADAAAWLASDGARWVTGVALPVEAGHLILPGSRA
jgi:SDR family mycofactocin-dependent oxidoreductase